MEVVLKSMKKCSQAKKLPSIDTGLAPDLVVLALFVETMTATLATTIQLDKVAARAQSVFSHRPSLTLVIFIFRSLRIRNQCLDGLKESNSLERSCNKAPQGVAKGMALDLALSLLFVKNYWAELCC